MSGLLPGWAAVHLRDVCELWNGRAYKQAELLNEGKYPVLRVGNFFSNRNWYFSNLELEPDKYCDSGDLLYAWSASFGPKIWDGGQVIYHYHIWRTQPNERVVAKRFLYYWFEWDKENIKAEHGTGSTMIHVTKGDMEGRPLCFPPLPEQQRIVAKIDGLSAKSKRANDHLDHIPRLVEKYKQAILAAAFRGELTRHWRNLSTAAGIEGVRSTIEASRRCRWLREERRKQAIRGREKCDAELLNSYRSTDLDSVVVAPVDGWCSAPIGSLGFVLGGKRLPKGAEYADSPTPFRYLRVTDFADRSIDVSAIKFIDDEISKAIAQYVVEAGDLIISIAGTIGATCVVPLELSGANLTENAAKIILGNAVVPRYLGLFLRSPEGQELISASTVATGQPKLALFRIEKIMVPLAPVSEQNDIVHRVEIAFAWIDRLATEATSARKLIDHLDQAVLAKAFRGELVPQDPNDEPASVLLDRIRAERAPVPAKVRRGPRQV